jgi:predicted ATPase
MEVFKFIFNFFSKKSIKEDIRMSINQRMSMNQNMSNIFDHEDLDMNVIYSSNNNNLNNFNKTRNTYIQELTSKICKK